MNLMKTEIVQLLELERKKKLFCHKEKQQLHVIKIFAFWTFLIF